MKLSVLLDVRSLWLLLSAAALTCVAGCQESPGRYDNPQIGPSASDDSQAVSALVRSEKAYRTGDYRQALVLADSAAQIDPGMAQAYFLKARIFTKLRRVEEAEATYRELAEIAPEYKGLWFNWGNLAYRRGKYRRALDLYRKEENPDLQARVYTNMGRAYARLQKDDSARHAYKKAIDADSTFTTALGWLSRLSQEQGDIEEAIDYSRRMVRLRPDDPDYRYMLGSQLVKAGQPEKARVHLEKMLEHQPGHPGAHYNLGRALIHLGEHDRANRHLTLADSLEEVESEVERQKSVAWDNPGRIRAWIELGNTLRGLERYEEALEAYQSAHAIAPHNPVILNNLASLYLETGDTTRALRQYQEILRRDSTSADTWFNLGVLYANQGEKEKARASWEKVLKYRPNDSTTKQYLRRLENQ